MERLRSVTLILPLILLLPPTQKDLSNSLGMKFRLVPAGAFQKADPNDDKPPRELKIAKPFYLAVHEVTQAHYQKVTGRTPSWFRAKGSGKARVRGLDTSTFPVEMVSWDDAVDFCRQLSELPEEKKAGRSYRLPTETEWEYACRAGTTTAASFGDRLSSDEANFHGYHPYGGAEKSTYLGRTSRVGVYPPNAWGLFDMHGNVWEWCADWLDDTRSRRVIRGGSWYGAGRLCLSGHRAGADPTERYHNIGFRVVAVVR